jgi:hypothetical protein
MTASAAASVGDPVGLQAPRFDPLQPRHRDRAFRRIFIVSLLLHLVFLFLFWDAVLGTVIQKEETVTVRMFEEELKPEPKKLRPKVLAQRRVDTKVHRFKEIAQPEIVEFRPTPVLDQIKKIEVDPLETTEAPKEIVTREVEARQLSVFADVPRPVAPVEIDVKDHKVQQVQVARGSAGPRKLEAAGPETTPEAVDVEAPTVREGVVSKSSVQGAYEGTRIAALESGAADRYLGEEGVPGAVKASKDCMRDPICLAYLKMVRDRVYARWQLPSSIAPGEVRLRFQIDRGGSAHGLRLVATDDSHLGDTCLAAFRHASPFPPPPREIEYLVGKGLVATFDYGR